MSVAPKNSVSTPAPLVSLQAQTATQKWTQGTSVLFELASSTFEDSQNEALTYSATLSNGSPLPSWLKFNAGTRTFSGIVPADLNGLSIKITATDSGGSSTSELFAVSTPSPILSLNIQTATQTWEQGAAVSFTLPSNTFNDSAGEPLTFSATQANGTALPSWLKFNNDTGTFSGTVPAGVNGLSIKVTAIDALGVSASETFSVATPAPVVSVIAQTATQTWKQGSAISLALPSSTFSDNAGEAMTYTASQANGAALPSWLKFNGTTETFSGVAPVGANGLSIKVTATDTAGVSASEIFNVSTPAPVVSVNAQTAAQIWKQGATISFALPAGTFTDSAGEVLTYSASQANGTALPNWLTFNATTGTFSGNVPVGSNGLSLKVTATDTAGVSASETIAVSTPVAPAMRAAGFLGTIGVNTHIPYTDGLYVNVAKDISDLAYLGITQVRDTISNGSNGSAPYASYLSLAKAGVHFTFSIEDSTTAALQSQLSEITTLNQAVPGSVTAVEGANEINNWPVTFNGVGGLQGAINLQSAIYCSVHSSPALTGVSVDYFTGYGGGGVAEGPNPLSTPGLADYDTQHPYPSAGQAPASAMNPAEVLGNEVGNLGPSVYTETGYSTVGTGYGVVNEDVQAKYTLDLLFDAAKDGVSKTYLYQLMDAYAPGSPQGDDGFGLFDYTQAPKEVATAIHDLTAILKDTGSNAQTFTMGSLAYSIQALPSTANSMLMEKSNGAYDLAIWNEPALWNPTTKQELTVAPTSVSVSLGSVAGRIEVYDPIVSSAPVTVLTNTSTIQLSLTADPLIIQIEPASLTLPTLTVTAPTAAQSFRQGSSVAFGLASNTFTDSQGETLAYAATQANGTALPSWLTFNSMTQTFSGTVPAATSGLSIKVTATDTGGISASESFAIATPALAPVLAAQTANQTWTAGQSVNLGLPGNAFTDPQGETLTYSATQVGGTALPTWLKFNSATDTFTGTAPTAASSLNLQVTAADTSGLSISETFKATIAAAASQLTQAISSLSSGAASAALTQLSSTTPPTLVSPMH